MQERIKRHVAIIAPGGLHFLAKQTPEFAYAKRDREICNNPDEYSAELYTSPVSHDVPTVGMASNDTLSHKHFIIYTVYEARGTLSPDLISCYSNLYSYL